MTKNIRKWLEVKGVDVDKVLGELNDEKTKKEDFKKRIIDRDPTALSMHITWSSGSQVTQADINKAVGELDVLLAEINETIAALE